MKTKDKIETKGKVVKLKFKVPKSFKDPLKTTNEDSFDEMAVEEFNHYYNIYLGVPVTHDEE